MRVQIDNVKILYGKDLVYLYPCLENYDYECQKIEKENVYGEKYTEYNRSIEISSLEELLKLKNDVDTYIIIEGSEDKEYPFKIMIYDDYIE